MSSCMTEDLGFYIIPAASAATPWIFVGMTGVALNNGAIGTGLSSGNLVKLYPDASDMSTSINLIDLPVGSKYNQPGSVSFYNPYNFDLYFAGCYHTEAFNTVQQVAVPPGQTRQLEFYYDFTDKNNNIGIYACTTPFIVDPDTRIASSSGFQNQVMQVQASSLDGESYDWYPGPWVPQLVGYVADPAFEDGVIFQGFSGMNGSLNFRALSIITIQDSSYYIESMEVLVNFAPAANYVPMLPLCPSCEGFAGPTGATSVPSPSCFVAHPTASQSQKLQTLTTTALPANVAGYVPFGIGPLMPYVANRTFMIVAYPPTTKGNQYLLPVSVAFTTAELVAMAPGTTATYPTINPCVTVSKTSDGTVVNVIVSSPTGFQTIDSIVTDLCAKPGFTNCHPDALGNVAPECVGFLSSSVGASCMRTCFSGDVLANANLPTYPTACSNFVTTYCTDPAKYNSTECACVNRRLNSNGGTGSTQSWPIPLPSGPTGATQTQPVTYLDYQSFFHGKWGIDVPDEVMQMSRCWWPFCQNDTTAFQLPDCSDFAPAPGTPLPPCDFDCSDMNLTECFQAVSDLVNGGGSEVQVNASCSAAPGGSPGTGPVTPTGDGGVLQDPGATTQSYPPLPPPKPPLPAWVTPVVIIIGIVFIILLIGMIFMVKTQVSDTLLVAKTQVMELDTPTTGK